MEDIEPELLQIALAIKSYIDKKVGSLPTDDEWLTVKQAAELANMSDWQVRQMVRRAEVEYYQPNPGKPPLRILRSSLLRRKAA